MDMFRHIALNRCVSPHNETCTIRADDGLPTRTCTPFASCYPGASDPEPGRQNGTCVCDRDAKHDPISAHCKLTYGSERCSTDTDCDVLALLSCQDDKCLCQDSELQRYDELSGKCKSLVGGSCVSVPPFVAPECLGPFMECDDEISGKCVCQSGFSQNTDKTCGKAYGDFCNPESSVKECHDHFVCDATDKKCVCQDGHMYQNGTCRILSGGACGSNELNCTEHAICENSVCTCSAPDFRAGADLRCEGLYGASCDNLTSPCATSDFLTCSPENNICTCMEKYESDDANKLCKGHIGQPCREGRDEDCIANSICKPGVENGADSCACPARHEASGELVCVGLYGAACDATTTVCSATRFLGCDVETSLCACATPASQLYEEARDTCVAKADTACLESAGGITCVALSTCMTTEPRICYCNPGYVADAAGRCVTPPTEPPPTDPPTM